MLDRADQLGMETIWDRYEKMLPECGFGELGVCCRNCNMGPCRISPFEDEGPQRGICGATADIIVARNLIRMIAGGAAAPFRPRPRPGPYPAADRRGQERWIRDQG